MASPSPSPSTTSPPPHHPSPPFVSLSEPPMATPLPLLLPPPSTVAVALAVPTPTTRRLPPPCWTPEETSALIDAYRDKWYSLRRGNLRAAHWQDVAQDVHRRCPHATPPKTPVQCRHKMEKLRKRYRAELLRAKSIPHHRFSSSWVYFSKMDAMEKGPTAAVATQPSPPVTTAVPTNLDEDDVDDDDDDDADEDYPHPINNGLRIKIPGNPNPNSNSGFRSMKRTFPEYDDNPNPNPNPSYPYKQQKYGNINSFSSPSPPQFEEGMRYGPRGVKNGVVNNGSAGSSGMNNNLNVNNPMLMMKNKRKSGLGLGKSDREDSSGSDPAMEMVEAIRMLGEGFVKMEKMKMDMIRETERMRMEMEMKRTQMILESQHRIVEAFSKGWAESMKSKKDASC